jgi:hypothetical protein
MHATQLKSCSQRVLSVATAVDLSAVPVVIVAISSIPEIFVPSVTSVFS